MLEAFGKARLKDPSGARGVAGKMWLIGPVCSEVVLEEFLRSLLFRLIVVLCTKMRALFDPSAYTTF